MTNLEKIYRDIAKSRGKSIEHIQKIIRSEFELVHNVMESADIWVEKPKDISLQYLGSFHASPYRYEKLMHIKRLYAEPNKIPKE